MATGSLTNYPWLFKKLSGQLSPQAFGALGRLPRGPTLRRRPSLSNLPQDNYEMADSRKPAIEDADSLEPAMKNADSPEPATKNADSKKPAKTAPTKTTPT